MRRLFKGSAQSQATFPRKRLMMACFGLGVIGCVLGLPWVWNVQSPLAIAASPGASPSVATGKKSDSKQRLLFIRKVTESGILYLIQVPAESPFQVLPQSSPSVSTLAQWPYSKTIQGAINAGYFDPSNGLTTSHVTLPDGTFLRPEENARFMKNPDLFPYHKAILNRTEWRTLRCPQEGPTGEARTRTQYQIAAHDAPLPTTCQLVAALGGGPRLLPTFTPEEEAFYKTNEKGRVVRDPLGVYKPNSRSAVGLTANGDVLLLMAGQSNIQPGAKGLTLPQTAEVLKTYGAVEAMALDGGSSSSLWFQGNVFWGKTTPKGEWVKRPVKTILAIESYKPE